MEKSLEQVCISLDNLALTILESYNDDRTFTEIFGWNCPALNRYDISNMAKNISKKIKKYDINEIDSETITSIQLIPTRINIFKTTTLPQLYNSNCLNAMTSYMALIDWINQTLNPIFSWEVLRDNKALPTQLVSRLRAIQYELSEIIPNKDEIKKQIQLIKNATEAAETLPTDLQSLKEARERVNILLSDATEQYVKIDSYQKKTNELSKLILEKKEETDKLVAQCEDAYKITTSKGLAGAFEQRAKKLSSSMWVWVLVLILALIIGMYIGSNRFDTLNQSLNNNSKPMSHIWIQIFLSVLSFGAPIWLAWIATKQISQRFRLSEDYAYKSSVAKAYEGYRREAARIDKAFEARLFSSALTRVEEAPLRLMEQDTPGSPWHELINSPQFARALELVPDLKNKFFDLTKKSFESAVTIADNKKPQKVNEE